MNVVSVSFMFYKKADEVEQLVFLLRDFTMRALVRHDVPFSARLEYNSEISGFINPSTISSRLHTVQLLKYVFHFVQKECNENTSASRMENKSVFL